MAKADLHNVTDDWGSASLQQDRASADWIGSTQDAIVESLQFNHDSVSWDIADHGIYLPSQGLEEAKDRCIGDYRCEVVCYHSKTGRAQYYQNFESLGSQVARLKMALAEDLLRFSLDSPGASVCFRLRKALREVEPGRKGWNELLQKAPPWEQNGWMCLQAYNAMCIPSTRNLSKQKQESFHPF